MKAAFGKTAVLAMFGLSVLLFQNCGGSKVNFDQNQKASPLQVDEIASTLDERGSYRGVTVAPDGTESTFIKTEQILRSESLANCELNALNNPSLNIRCYFNDEVIFDNSQGSSASLGNYSGYMIGNGETVNFIRTNSISKADALANCQLNAKQNSDHKFLCYWNDQVIFRN